MHAVRYGRRLKKQTQCLYSHFASETGQRLCQPFCFKLNIVNGRSLHLSTGRKFSDTWSEDKKAEEKRDETDRKNADEEEAIKKKILDASLAHVAKHGWTRLALASGAEDIGFVSVVSGLFPREGDDLVLHHIRESNKKLDEWMISELEKFKAEEKKLPVSNFIKSAVRQRLTMNQPYIKDGRWSEALTLMAKPQNIPESVGLLQQLCDDIWHRAGDNSADLNWYSKRMLLAGIVSSTEVFMIQDTSTDFQDTWGFLDRRFEDIAGIPQIGKIPQDITGIISGLVTTAKIVAGVQK